MLFLKTPSYLSFRALPILCVGILSACAVGPDFKQPEAPKTSSYTESALSKKLATAPGVSGGTEQEFIEGADIEALFERLHEDVPENQTVMFKISVEEGGEIVAERLKKLLTERNASDDGAKTG